MPRAPDPSLHPTPADLSVVVTTPRPLNLLRERVAWGEAINTTVTLEKKKKLKQDHRHTPALLNTTRRTPLSFLLSTSTVSAASLTTSLSPQHSLTRTDTHLEVTYGTIYRV